MSAKEKIAWLKGLLSGLEIEGREAKIYGAVADALDALATQIEEQNEQMESLRSLYDELEEECTALEEDVSALEDLFDEYAKEDDDEDEERYATSYVSVTCPSCSSVFYYEQGENEDSDMLECPDCGKKFPLSIAFVNNDQEEMDS